jgi:cell division protein FtsB
MRAVTYLISVWTAVAVYSLCSLFTGAVGLSAYKQLSDERDKQLVNIETLWRRNQELEGAKNALLYDRDTIAIYARDLGYGTETDNFVRIVGLPGAQKQPAAAGDMAIAADPEAVSGKTISIIALAAGLGMFLCLSIADVLRSAPLKRRK